MQQEEHVILVNEQDESTGTMPKMAAHETGALHRAFSIFIFNSRNELILQRRAAHKYHSGGLWTNTCCSHPRPGESLDEAVHRRLQEEMGFDTEMRKVFSFIYRQQVGELMEHELDHVFVGRYDGAPELNLEEADDWKALPVQDIVDDMARDPERYTVWFRICLEKAIEYWNNQHQQTSHYDMIGFSA
ncbi:MAG: isopentenyl-diphosphate Delta-isomerase [Bacteroidota bacterium]